MDQLVFLCGGMGSRLNDAKAASTPKCMIPVDGDPLLAKLVRLFSPMVPDPHRSIFIVRADDPIVPAWVRENLPGATLVPQDKPDGVANAVHLALPHVEERAVVLLGDVYFSGAFSPWPAQGSALFAWPEASDQETRNNFGIRMEDATPVELIEKPRDLTGLQCGLGVYLLTREAIARFPETPRNPRSGEREITAALAFTLAQGVPYEVVSFRGQYVNVNDVEDLARVAELEK